ncbi:hypothetical protein JCM8547_003362 [Rhodosporidiobolus lusitaniae]
MGKTGAADLIPAIQSCATLAALRSLTFNLRGKGKDVDLPALSSAIPPHMRAVSILDRQLEPAEVATFFEQLPSMSNLSFFSFSIPWRHQFPEDYHPAREAAATRGIVLRKGR